MNELSAYTFSYFTDLTSAVTRTNNKQGELFWQLALAMRSGDQKCPSQPSEPAERKRIPSEKNSPEKCLYCKSQGLSVIQFQ